MNSWNLNQSINQRAIRRKFSRKTPKDEKHNHWLEFASDKYDKQLIEDIKRVLAGRVFNVAINYSNYEKGIVIFLYF